MTVFELVEEGTGELGAGLGGCIMVFVRNENIDELKTKLIKEFYSPNNLEPGMITSQPVAGSGLLTM